jgi:methyl-accepting chemotaxis protein
MNILVDIFSIIGLAVSSTLFAYTLINFKTLSGSTKDLQDSPNPSYLKNEDRENLVNRKGSHEFGENIQEILSIVDVLSSIAGRTNILAVNAAIESARAGEQGRWRAAASVEVMTLAETTINSTQNITSLMLKIDKASANISEEQALISKYLELNEKVFESLSSNVVSFEAIYELRENNAQIRAIAENWQNIQAKNPSDFPPKSTF